VTIDELAEELPNGFHDSILRSHGADSDAGTAEFVLDVWLGDLNSDVESDRERYRSARIDLVGLSYLIVDAEGLQDRAPKTGLQIDLCDADEDVLAARPTGAGQFAARFFVSEWNAFIHFAASDARLTWLRTN